MRRVTVSFRPGVAGEESTASIAHIKQAGMAVSVVLPYGLRDPETLETLADVINGLPLGRGDFVYLMEAQGDDTLAEHEVRRQRESLKPLLAATHAARAPGFGLQPREAVDLN